MHDRKDHWETVYETRAPEAVSWFQADPALSRAAILAACAPSDPVIDIGGGASRLVDDLLDAEFSDLTVLDISAPALAAARARLGDRADQVTWLIADITAWVPDRHYALWHDRAVFHFLTDPADRAAYAGALRQGLRPGGTAVISTFADDGPEKCSGLPVQRYAPGDLAAELDRLLPGLLRPVSSERQAHVTPGGAEQRFQTSVFRAA